MLSITISFAGRDGVEVADGAAEGAPAMAGAWLEMSRVCSGRISPMRALAQRDLKLSWGRRIWVVPAGGFVLSVPASFYGDTSVARRRWVVAFVVVSVLVVLLAVLLLARG